jgi:N-methylhydantoinase B
MSERAHGSLDAITFEVLRGAFEYACERMGRVLQRTSFSPIIYDMLDYSNAIFDEKAQLIGQFATSPVHLASMHYSLEAALRRYPEGLGPEDVVILNDPYDGGTHMPDVSAITPIHYGDELLGYAVSRAHWTDIGGGAAGGQDFGSHIAGEGLRLPPVKLIDDGRVNEDIFGIIRNATRTPHYVDGDVQAQLGALRAAQAELMRLAERYGVATLRDGMRQVLDYTERMTRAAIARVPDGTYEAEDYADTDGFTDDPIRVRVRIVVAGDEIELDFEGSDPIALGAINSPIANTVSAIYYSLKFFLSPEAPQNAGMYRPIHINVPEGTWLNARWPAPTIACTTLTSSKIGAVIWQALAKAIPDRAIAPTFSEGNWFVANIVDPAGAGSQVFSDIPAGGWGGTPFHDGMNVSTDPLSNCMNMPAESAELLFPLQYERFELRPDSGGAGQFRGGLGAVLQIRWRERTELSMECSRTREGSPGVNGGGASPPQRQIKVGADGGAEVIGGWTESGEWRRCILASHPFEAGEAFRFESTGGGGWGDPLERDPEQVLEDVLDGLVSEQQARERYGVVVAAGVALDVRATTDLRARLRGSAR